MVQELKAGVIGNPVSQSLSPFIFSYLSEMFGLPLSYRPYRQSSESIGEMLNTCNNRQYVGFNITLPFKRTVLEHLDDVDNNASRVGAANVIQYQRGRKIGWNTDVDGVVHCLEESEIEVRNSAALLIGAGGAASAIANALAMQGLSRLFVLNRTEANGLKLCREIRALYPQMECLFVKDTSELPVSTLPLVANATSYESHIFSETLFKLQEFKIEAIFDANYIDDGPNTAINQQFPTAQYLGGLDMLIWQALRTWEIWFGPLTNKRVLKSRIGKFLKGLGEK